MSMPSMRMAPLSGSKARCSRPSVVDLPEPVVPTSATVSPARAVKETSSTALRRGGVGEADGVERDLALEALDLTGVRPVVDGRRRVEDLEELGDLGHLQEQPVDEARDLVEAGDQHGGDGHEHHDFADGGEAVQVQHDADEEDRRHGERRGGAGRDVGERPPGQDRDLRGEQVADDAVQRVLLRLGAGEGLDDRDVAERVRGVFGEARMVGLDLALQGLGAADDERGQHREDEDQHHQDRAELPVQEQGQRQEHAERDDGDEMVAEEAEPQPGHAVRALQHHLQHAAGMGRGVEGERQFEDVLEIIRHRREAAAMGQPVGMQRDGHAGGDREQAERRPRPPPAAAAWRRRPCSCSDG